MHRKDLSMYDWPLCHKDSVSLDRCEMGLEWPSLPGGDEVQRRGEEGGSQPGHGDPVHSQPRHPAVREDVEPEMCEGTSPAGGAHGEEGPGCVFISGSQRGHPHYRLPPVRPHLADLPQLLFGRGLASGCFSRHGAQASAKSGGNNLTQRIA